MVTGGMNTYATHGVGYRSTFHSPGNQGGKKGVEGGVNEMENRLKDGLVRRITNS